MIRVKLDNIREKKKDKKRRRWLFRSSIIVLLVAATAFAVYSNNKPEESTYKVGDMAPDFKLQVVNEHDSFEDIQLSELQGKGVMINFSDTNCTPCEREIPYMEEVYASYQDKGIEFVTVSLDLNDFVVEKFVQMHEISFPVVKDNKEQVKNLYNIHSVPSKLFINADGEIVDIANKMMEPDELRQHLEQIIPD